MARWLKKRVCVTDDGKAEPKPRGTIGLPCLDGTTPLEPYLAQIELATLHNRWDWNKAGVHIFLALEGKALQVLVSRPLREHQDAEQLIVALRQRFRWTEPEEMARDQSGEIRRKTGET